MGVWEEYCCVCGGPSKIYRLSELAEDMRDPADIKKLQVTLHNAKPWVTKWIGIDSSEKMYKLGAYDMYGGFQLSGKAVFNLATNYENENVQPGAAYGIACHTACKKLLKDKLDYKICYGDVWHRLGGKLAESPSLLPGTYGGIREYQGQDFDWCRLAINGDAWMVADPNKDSRNAARILKIWRPVVKQHKQPLRSKKVTRTKTTREQKPGVVCKNCPPGIQKRYKGTEPSPNGMGFSASYDPVGKKRIGKDKSTWVVQSTAAGRKVWKKL